MATAAIAPPVTPTDDSTDRFSLLELDPLPVKEVIAPPVVVKPLAPPSAPGLSPSAIPLLATILTCVTHYALQTLAMAFTTKVPTDLEIASWPELYIRHGRMYRMLTTGARNALDAAWRKQRDLVTLALAWGNAFAWVTLLTPPTPPVAPVLPAASVPPSPLAIPREGYPLQPNPAGTLVDVLRGVSAETRSPARPSPMRARVTPQVTPTGVLRPSNLIAGSIARGHGSLISWGRARNVRNSAAVHDVPHADIVAAMATLGRSDGPKEPSAEAQFGHVMGTLNGNGIVARAATKKRATEQWPADTRTRWVVGYVNADSESDSLGRKELIVELTTADTLRFVREGSSLMANRIRMEYQLRCDGKLHTATTLIAWFESTLYKVHYARSCGDHAYIPAGEVSTVKALIDAVKPLMGRTFQAISVVSPEEIMEGLSEGFSDEVSALRAKYDRETERNPKGIGERMACTLLRECHDLREKLTGYTALLGAEAVTTIRETLNALDGTLRNLCDDTSSRFAALDLE